MGPNRRVKPISLATRVLIVTFHYSQWQRGDSNVHLEEVRQGPVLRHQSKRGTQTMEWLWGDGALAGRKSKLQFELTVFLMIWDEGTLGSLSTFLLTLPLPFLQPLIQTNTTTTLYSVLLCKQHSCEAETVSKEAQMRSEQSPALFYWNQIPL